MRFPCSSLQKDEARLTLLPWLQIFDLSQRMLQDSNRGCCALLLFHANFYSVFCFFFFFCIQLSETSKTATNFRYYAGERRKPAIRRGKGDTVQFKPNWGNSSRKLEKFKTDSRQSLQNILKTALSFDWRLWEVIRKRHSLSLSLSCLQLIQNRTEHYRRMLQDQCPWAFYSDLQWPWLTYHTPANTWLSLTIRKVYLPFKFKMASKEKAMPCKVQK